MTPTPSVRLVVTGVNADGKSVIVSDERRTVPCPYPAYPGYAITRLWPAAGAAPTGTEARFIVFQFPPDRDVLPHLAHLQTLGGAGSLSMDEASFGMHQNASTDFIVVLSGEIWLRVDDDIEVHLQPGDCVVQGGARHAWRNRGAVPCLMAGVLVRDGTH